MTTQYTYSDAASATYSVSITGPEGTAGKTYFLADSADSVTFDGTTNKAILSSVKVNTPITITGLPIGQYTITETGADRTGYTLHTSYLDNDSAYVTTDGIVNLTLGGTETVPAASSGTITITNTYTTTGGGGGGSETPNNPGPGTTTTEINEPQTPLAEVPAEPTQPTEEIADEPVALASVPETGDMSALWFTLSGLSAVALAGVYVLGKKRMNRNAQ